MRVGLYFDMRNPPQWRRPWSHIYGHALELAEEADRLGVDGLWFSEHHLFEDGYLPQPLTMAAAVAARTRRARLGTAVLLAPLRSALHVAEEAAVVDLLSGGRVDLGLGAGYRVPEFEAYGADFSTRYKTTDARAREIRRLFDEQIVTPPPAQERLPIWLGYQGPLGARRAGLLGEGLLTANPAMYEPYRAGLEEAGHDPSIARMQGHVQAVVADDPDSAWGSIREHVAYQQDSYLRYSVEGTGRPPPEPVDPDRLRHVDPTRLPRFLVATPDDMATTLRNHLGGTRVEGVLLWVSIAGMPDRLVERHVELVCTHLIPLLRNVESDGNGGDAG